MKPITMIARPWGPFQAVTWRSGRITVQFAKGMPKARKLDIIHGCIANAWSVRNYSSVLAWGRVLAELHEVKL